MCAMSIRSFGNFSAIGWSRIGFASSSDTFAQNVVPWWISTGTPSASALAINARNRSSCGWMF